MKELFINNSQTPAQIDDEDYNRLSCYHYNLHNGSITRQCSLGRVHRNVPITNDIMYCYTIMYDHIDTNYFNCQKRNLRPCTRKQNAANRSKSVGTSSKYKGVTWKETRKKWEAAITCGRYKYLGGYDTEEQAAHAYNEEAKIRFKEFANLNKNEQGEIL